MILDAIFCWNIIRSCDENHFLSKTILIVIHTSREYDYSIWQSLMHYTNFDWSWSKGFGEEVKMWKLER